MSARNHPAVPFKLQLPCTPWAAEVFRVFRNQQVLNLCRQRQMLESSWTVEQLKEAKPNDGPGQGPVQQPAQVARTWIHLDASKGGHFTRLRPCPSFHVHLFIKECKQCFCCRNITQSSSSSDIFLHGILERRL